MEALESQSRLLEPFPGISGPGFSLGPPSSLQALLGGPPVDNRGTVWCSLHSLTINQAMIWHFILPYLR